MIGYYMSFNPSQGPTGLLHYVEQIYSSVKARSGSPVSSKLKAAIAKLTSGKDAIAKKEAAQLKEEQQQEALLYPSIKGAVEQLNANAYQKGQHSNLKKLGGKYYVVSPLKPYTYFDFNVDSKLPGDKGSGKKVGVFYDNDGKPFRVASTWLRETMLMRYGLFFDSAGNETLGVPVSHVHLPMTSKDKALKPGASGNNMIDSTDPRFPLPGISIETTSDGKTAYFYYSNKIDSTDPSFPSPGVSTATTPSGKTAYFYYNNQIDSYLARLTDQGSLDYYLDLVSGQSSALRPAP